MNATKTRGRTKEFMNKHSAKVMAAVGLGLIIAGLKFCTGGQEPPMQGQSQNCIPVPCKAVPCEPPTKEVRPPCPEGSVCSEGPEKVLFARGNSNPSCGNGVLEEGAILKGLSLRRGDGEDVPTDVRYTETGKGGRTKSGERLPDFWHIKVDNDGTTHIVNPCPEDEDRGDGRRPEKATPVEPPPQVKSSPPPVKAVEPAPVSKSVPFSQLPEHPDRVPGALAKRLEDIVQVGTSDLSKAGVNAVFVMIRVDPVGGLHSAGVGPSRVPGDVRARLADAVNSSGLRVSGQGQEMRMTHRMGVSQGM